MKNKISLNKKRKNECGFRKLRAEKNPTGLILIFVFFADLSAALYSSVSVYIINKCAVKAMADYVAYLQNIKREDYPALFDAANKYNVAIQRIEFPFIYYEYVLGYEEVPICSIFTPVRTSIIFEEFTNGLPVPRYCRGKEQDR